MVATYLIFSIYTYTLNLPKLYFENLNDDYYDENYYLGFDHSTRYRYTYSGLFSS